MSTYSQTRGASLEFNAFLKEYGAGAGTRAIRKLQRLIAPVVRVPNSSGEFKKNDFEVTLKLPKSIKRIGSANVVSVSMAMFSGSYNCDAHALNIPISNAGRFDISWLAKDAIDHATEIAGQVVERDVIADALEYAGPAVPMSWVTSPTKAIDEQIREMILDAKAGEFAVIFGVIAWEKFKQHADVKALGAAALSWDTCPNLFHTGARFETAYSIHDVAPPGLEYDINFMFPPNEVLIVASAREASRRDPSFMKTFTTSEDNIPETKALPSNCGRDTVITLNLSMDVELTNEKGARRFEIGE